MNASVQTILVNYKNTDDTIACLRALEKQTVKPNCTYVVDNASSEESKGKFLKETFGIPIKFIWNEANLGFAAACNQGIKEALESGFKGFVWLLNNDTEPEAHALESILEKAIDTRAGITGSRIVSESGKFLGGVGIVHPKFASVRRPQNTDCTDFDYIEGSSFLISPKCLQEVGPLCEDFFLYFEESDYCFKAKKAGFSLAWATDSIVCHHIGATTQSENKKGKVPFFIDCLMIRNRVHFAHSNGFPRYGIFVGLLISLCLRVKRLQFKRVLTIMALIASEKTFRKFVEKNGGWMKDEV